MVVSLNIHFWNQSRNHASLQINFTVDAEIAYRLTIIFISYRSKLISSCLFHTTTMSQLHYVSNKILTCANYFRNLSFRLANTFVCLVHHANAGNIQYIYDQIFWSAVGVSAPVAGVNRGYTLTSTVDGAGDALGLRRTYGPLTGFQPNEFREYKVTFLPWMSQKVS